MKQLKFRVWSPLMGEFCLDTEDGYFGQEEDFANGIFAIESFDKDEVIQQFTGLKDKNGKEIFEGDIVIYTGRNDLTYSKPGVVSIGTYYTHSKEIEHYGVRVKRLDMRNCYFGLPKGNSKEFMIIGNEFEDPDLLLLRRK